MADNVEVTASLKKGDTSQTIFKIPVDSVMAPSLELLHRNLFDLLLLIKRGASPVDKTPRVPDTVLCRHGRLAMGTLAAGDSLFKDRQFGQFSTLNDVTVAGSRYKSFSLPFRFNGQDLVLTGLIKETDYRANATGYSKPLVLGVVTVMVFLILSLPLVKIYLSSRQERINAKDVRLVIVVMTAAPFFFIFIALTLLVYMHMDEQSDANLDALRGKVERNLTREVRLGLDQLKRYKSVLETPAKDFCTVYNRHRQCINPTGKGADLRDLVLYPDLYKNLDDVYWINGDGRQLAKWRNSDSGGVVSLDLSQRGYFKKLRSGRGFTNGGDSFYLEPVVSWSSGQYTVNLVMPSQQVFPGVNGSNSSRRAVMIGLSGRMYSVCDPVLPKGYQFCIIDEAGKILFHSQTERSLHENLFDESSANFELRNAVFKKQKSLLYDVALFDRDVKLLVSPMEGFPSLYTVTYFAKREGNLFVYHVSSFTLLCVSTALFLLLVLLTLFSVLDAAKVSRHSRLLDTAWMQPAFDRNELYKRIIAHQLQVLAVTAVLLAVMIALTKYGYWFLFEASMALPFYVATSYYFLANNHKLENDQAALQKANRKIWWVYGPFMAVFLAGLNYLQYRRDEGGGISWWGVFFIVFLSVVGPLLAALQLRLRRMKYKWLLTPYRKGTTEGDAVPQREIMDSVWFQLFFHKPTWLYSKHYGANYRRAIRFTIFVVAVLPVMGIMSFGLNEESKMQIKAGQFDAARQLEQRRERVNEFIASTKLDTACERAFIRQRKLDTAFGTYLFEDELTWLETKSASEGRTVLNSHYYQALTRFLFLPKDHADFFESTNAYRWTQGDGDEINLSYTNETDAVTPEGIAIRHKYRGHIFLIGLFKSVAGLLILLTVIAYFVIHFTLVGTASKKIFLLDYFRFGSDGDDTAGVASAGLAWINGFYRPLQVQKDDRVFLQVKSLPSLFGSKQEPVDHRMVEATEARHPNDEEAILRLQHIVAPAYDAMWAALKPEEKYLLFDFALDGFTNYKNVDLLYGMYRKGLIRKREYRLELMNASFRNYLTAKSGSAEIQQLERELSGASTWKSLKNVLLITFFATLIFLFVTQQDVLSNKIIAIVSGLATLVPVLLRVFDRGGSGGDAKK